ncbi:MAG TPA: hemerythrin domain-containing protein [Actinospica sp.]|jgi:hypothetical protein|nr:hemerythrin domain-containing protein [Actinospica sp.]
MTPDQDGSSIFTVLHDQHVRTRDLLSEVAGSSGVARQQAFDALRELLAAHEAAEEVVLRPTARRLAYHEITVARDGEERRIAAMLAALEKLDVDGPAFAETFGTMGEAILMHTWYEEAEEFPAVKARLTLREQQRMGTWTQRAFALAPTHPHPAVAGSPVAQWTVGPFTALMDRARDGFTRAREALDLAAMREGEW